MSIYLILGILFFHWLFDFVLQTDKQAKLKSRAWDALLEHTVTYSLSWLMVVIIYMALYWGISQEVVPLKMLLFPVITFICHTATDYYTSRVHRQLYEAKDTHTFFASIGFDQFLHYVQLFGTYQLLIG